ncbi:MAG: DUF1963 domain-containing protein [Desulfobacterales bacterium]|nr:DUF1963 domain-containing protein [Desulfobacterales bacterium]
MFKNYRLEKLFKAARNGETSKVLELIKKGLDINTVKYGNTVLLEAILSSNPETVQVLLENGAKMDFLNSQGLTALKAAFEYDRFDVVKPILEYGESPDTIIKDVFGTTALIQAVIINRTDIVKLLLQNGAKVNNTNKYNESALYYAVKQGYNEIAAILKKAGGIALPKVYRNQIFIGIDKILNELDLTEIDLSELDDPIDNQILVDSFTYVIAIETVYESDQNNKTLPIGSSKLGGLPHLPEDFIWPEDHYFFVQLNINDFKKYDLNNEFPEYGMIYLFTDNDGYGKAFYSKAPIESLKAREYSFELNDYMQEELSEKEFRFHPNFYFETYSMDEIVDYLPKSCIQKICKLLNTTSYERFTILHEHMLGENVTWQGEDPLKKSGYTLVFQYDTGEGSVYIGVHPVELKRGEFSNAIVYYCGT